MALAEGVIARDIAHAPVMPDNGTSTPYRQWSRREMAVVPVLPDFKAAGDEGSYCVGTNATPGTGVAGPSAAAFSATSAIFSFLNPNGPGGTRALLDYIRLIVTAVPTAGTRFDLAITLDNAVRGTAGTPVSLFNPNSDSAVQGPNTKVLYNPTVSSPVAARQVARATVKAATPVVGDEYLILFGSVEKPGAMIASATVAGRYVIPVCPVILGGGGIQSALVHLWSPSSTTAPSFEFDVGLIER